jgi:glycosyltransferase involved in cell wall biosynthesis
VIAISECTRRDLIELLGTDPTRIHVIYPGRSHVMRPIPPADAIRITERYGVSGPYILYAGSLGPHKNVPALFRAYEQARACGGVSARLVVVGDDRWAAETLSAIGRLQVGSDVVLLGFVPADDLPYFYAGAMCFAFPSMYEGFGLPVLEAMACGTPVIVSNSGALPEVVGGAGVVIDPADVGAFAGAIRRLVSDADLRATLSARALERAGHFSWEQSAKALLAVLSGTAAQGH